MSDFEVFDDVASMRAFSRQQRRQNKTIALVPTMGCLHSGHVSLIEEAGKLADTVVVSIYVNPTQFSKNEDFGVYPKCLAEDEHILKKHRVSAVFQPHSMYYKADAEADPRAADEGNVVGTSDLRPGDHETFVQTELLQRHLCGRSRPHFFRGVATVVCKLFNIIEPDVAIFGSKDFQQLQVIKRLVRDLDFCIKVVGMPIVREPDGLAMSSRNKLLSSTDRESASAIYKALQWASLQAKSQLAVPVEQIIAGVTHQIQAAGGQIDYVEIVDADTLEKAQEVQSGQSVLLVAVFYQGARLIDNAQL